LNDEVKALRAKQNDEGQNLSVLEENLKEAEKKHRQEIGRLNAKIKSLEETIESLESERNDAHETINDLQV